jgi:hypothetical protein
MGGTYTKVDYPEPQSPFRLVRAEYQRALGPRIRPSEAVSTDLPHPRIDGTHSNVRAGILVCLIHSRDRGRHDLVG